MTIPAAPPAWLLIGIGNEYRSDDAAGLYIARALRQHLSDSCPLRVMEWQGDGAGLLDLWQGFETVMLADAVRSGSAPGTIHRLDLTAESPEPEPVPRGSSHIVGVREAIGLARTLGCLPPRLVLYGIEAQRLDPGSLLSPAVAQAVEQVVDRIREEIRRQFDETIFQDRG